MEILLKHAARTSMTFFWKKSNAISSKANLSCLAVRWSHHTDQTKSKEISKEGKKSEEEEEEGPVQFSSSEAARWQARYSRKSEWYYTTPRSEGIVVLVCFSVFMIYFCILREENDLDDWIRTLENTTPMTMEEALLRSQISTDLKEGKDVTAKRLALKDMVEKRMHASPSS